MVQLVRDGVSQRNVARQFGVSLNTVQRWLRRAADAPLDQVDWSDQTSGASESPKRCDAKLEDRVLAIRNVKGLVSETELLDSAERIQTVPPRYVISNRPSTTAKVGDHVVCCTTGEFGRIDSNSTLDRVVTAATNEQIIEPDWNKLDNIILI